MKDSPVGTALLPALSNNSGEEDQKTGFHDERNKKISIILILLTSHGRPSGIYDDGEIHVVSRLNKREDGVYIDLVP